MSKYKFDAFVQIDRPGRKPQRIPLLRQGAEVSLYVRNETGLHRKMLRIARGLNQNAVTADLRKGSDHPIEYMGIWPVYKTGGE